MRLSVREHDERTIAFTVETEAGEEISRTELHPGESFRGASFDSWRAVIAATTGYPVAAVRLVFRL